MKPLPQDESAELGIIGCCMLGGLDTTIEAMARVPDKAFYHDHIGLAWTILCKMAQESRQIDLVTFSQEWPKHHKGPLPSQLMGAITDTPSAANLPYYVETVMECFRRRRVMLGANELLANAGDRTKSVPELLADVEGLIALADMEEISIADAKESLRAMVDSLQERFERQGKLGGIETGFRQLDNMLDGLQLGEMTVIGARPSMGKTAIGLNILDHACLGNQIPSLFVTLEMASNALMRRLLSSRQRISMQSLKKGLFSSDDFKKIAAFKAMAEKCPLHIVDRPDGMNCAEFKAVCMRAVRKYGIKLICLDYLQLMNPIGKHDKRAYEIAEVSKAIRATSRHTGAAVVALCQLNRESEKDNRQGKLRTPKIVDIADSSQIEKDADAIALIHRPEGRQFPAAEIIVAKQRDGETGVCEMEFDGAFCQFKDRRFNTPIPDERLRDD